MIAWNSSRVYNPKSAILGKREVREGQDCTHAPVDSQSFTGLAFLLVDNSAMAIERAKPAVAESKITVFGTLAE